MSIAGTQPAILRHKGVHLCTLAGAGPLAVSIAPAVCGIGMAVGNLVAGQAPNVTCIRDELSGVASGLLSRAVPSGGRG